MIRRKREILIVTTEDAPIKEGNNVLRVCSHLDEISSPLVLTLVGSLFGSFLHDDLKVPYFNGFPPDGEGLSGNTVKTSKIEKFPDIDQLNNG